MDMGPIISRDVVLSRCKKDACSSGCGNHDRPEKRLDTKLQYVGSMSEIGCSRCLKLALDN
jgi:hypothetical protein